MDGDSVEVDVSNQQTILPVDVRRLRDALISALQLEHVRSAVLSVTIVDNATIHRMNRDFLNHDYPTDVISFQLEFAAPDITDEKLPASDDDPEKTNPAALRGFGASIEGEIVASAEMASMMAPAANWSAQSELILYVVHGMLHICGYDDQSPEEQAVMRSREASIMSHLQTESASM